MTYVPKTNIVTKPKTPAALAKLKGTYQPCRHKDDVADEFGFSPSARTRITLQNKPDENTDIYGDGI
jgi:hypothetical protein